MNDIRRNLGGIPRPFFSSFLGTKKGVQHKVV